MTTLCLLAFLFAVICTLVALAVCRASGMVTRWEEGQTSVLPVTMPGPVKSPIIKDDEQ